MKLDKIIFNKNSDSTYNLSLNPQTAIENAEVYIEVNDEKVNPLENAYEECQENIKSEFGVYTSKTYIKELKGLELVTEFQIYNDKIFISLQIANNSEETVFLGKCGLLNTYSSGNVDMGKIDDIRILCRDGWGVRSEVLNLTDSPFFPRQWKGNAQIKPTRHRTVITGDIYNLKNKICLSTSFLTFDRANSVIYYSNENNSLQFEALCDFANFELFPAHTQKSEILRLAADTSYDACMKYWADDVVKQYKPSFNPKAALGVLGESWCSGLTGDYSYQEMVLRNAKAVSERLGGFNVEYFWVSISNLKDRVPGNWLSCEYKQIHNDTEGLAEDLKHFDMKLGLWFAPFWIPDKFSNQAESQKNQLLKTDGVPTKDNTKWLRGISGKYPENERLSFYCRDGSSKEAEEYIREVLTKYREAGVKYYMIDFLWAGAGDLYGPFGYNEYEDKSKIAGTEVYRNLLKVIRETTGDDTYIVSSTGPTFVNTGLVDGSRTGPDIGEGRAALPDYSNYPGTFVLNNKDNLVRSCINMSSVYHLNGKFYHCDSFNVVTIDKPIPLSEAQITVSLAAMFESPMMIGDPVFSLSEDRLKLLKKALPQNKVEETAIPLDLFETEYGDCPKMYHLPIERRWGKYSILGLLNTENETKTFSVNLADLGYDKDCVLYDFWDERFLGIKNGKCSFEVAPNSIRVIRITPYENRPQLIGTDMHVLQGAVEILHTDFEEDVLTIGCKRPIGESGTVTILAPDNYIPLKYEGFHISKIAGTNLCLITKEINFDIPTVSVVLPFKKSDQKGGDGSNDRV